MTRRRGILVLGALLGATALAWSALGTFDAAMGQAPPIIIDRAHQGAHRPTFTEPIFVIVLGSDARDGLPERTRYDSIHIIGLNPQAQRATIIGIPRDSWVQSSQGFGMRKITDLGPVEGLDGFIETVENLSGCAFDYSMATAFEGFAGPYWRTGKARKADRGGLINEIGGITGTIPQPGVTDRDALHRLDPIPPGRQVLNGPQLLAFSRVRKQTSIAPGGDFGRSANQGTVMKWVLAELARDYRQDPGTALRNLAAAKRLIKVNIPPLEMLRLGLFTLRIKPARVRNLVVDGTTDTVNGTSIVRITSRGRQQLADVCDNGLVDAG